MGSEYRSYLAANVLNGDRVITYRLLSRALKIHVNTAKEMLFEFHRQQNGRKPGTVHATYLVAGSKRADAMNPQNQKSEDDEHMQSSPFRSSPFHNVQELIEDTPVLSISLAREEEMESVRALYETITSIHVYSLGPHPLKDLQALSNASWEVEENHSDQDSIEAATIHGTIVNKGVRRRRGRRPPAQPPSTAVGVKPKPLDVSEDSKVITSSSSSSDKADLKSSQSSAAKDFFGKSTSKKETAAGTSENRPPPTRRDPSSIFKAFAKAKPKIQRQGTDSSAGASGVDSATLNGPNDEPMKDASDDGEDEYVVPQPSSKQLVEKDRRSRKEREEALKKMMEDEDMEEPATPTEIEESEPEQVVSEELPSGEKVEVVEVYGGRKRGRRRIMKKKTVKDEEGYLVTREEPAWESFSEDEPVVTKTKAASSSFNSNSGKGLKSTGKAGQGNIMSFFGKPK